MKISELVKDGWPEETWLSDHVCNQKVSCPACVEIGRNMAITAIEPIKEMEVGVDEKKVQNIIYDELYRLLGTDTNRREACRLYAHALAANLDKFLVVEKGKNA